MFDPRFILPVHDCPYAHYFISTRGKYAALVVTCFREYMLSLTYDMK
jgi:hypothetical protein